MTFTSFRVEGGFTIPIFYIYVKPSGECGVEMLQLQG